MRNFKSNNRCKEVDLLQFGKNLSFDRISFSILVRFKLNFQDIVHLLGTLQKRLRDGPPHDIIFGDQDLVVLQHSLPPLSDGGEDGVDLLCCDY